MVLKTVLKLHHQALIMRQENQHENGKILRWTSDIATIAFYVATVIQSTQMSLRFTKTKFVTETLIA